MNIEEICSELQIMLNSDNIDTVAHSYIKILTMLEKEYKSKITELVQEDNNRE